MLPIETRKSSHRCITPRPSGSRKEACRLLPRGLHRPACAVRHGETWVRSPRYGPSALPADSSSKGALFAAAHGSASGRRHMGRLEGRINPILVPVGQAHDVDGAGRARATGAVYRQKHVGPDRTRAATRSDDPLKKGLSAPRPRRKEHVHRRSPTGQPGSTRRRSHPSVPTDGNVEIRASLDRGPCTFSCT